LVPIWISSAPTSAASAGNTRPCPRAYASAVPTSTGATAALIVFGRKAITQVDSDGRAAAPLVTAVLIAPAPSPEPPAPPRSMGRPGTPAPPPRTPPAPPGAARGGTRRTPAATPWASPAPPAAPAP